MNRKLTLAGMTGIAFFLGCGGSAHKLGGDTQANENAGGSAGSAETGGVAGNGQGGDPFAQGGQSSDGFAGGQFGGSVGSGGRVDPTGIADAGVAGGSYGGVPGVAGGSYGGSAGYETGGVAGQGGGSQGGVPGSGGQAVGAGGQAQPEPPGPQATPGITASGSGGAAGEAFVGTWTGYVENKRFRSGSDALLLSIQRTSATELSGQLTMGQGTGAVPDPSVMVGFFGTATPSPMEPIEGYAYTLMNGKVTGTRIEFDVALNEIWQSYCSAQTPVPGKYACIWSEGGYTFDSGHCIGLDATGQQRTEVDCSLLAMCTGGGCVCDDTHCFADTRMYISHFDMTLRSPYLDGSAYGNSFMPNNVHFTPQ
jgi:hypothetical protein